MVRQTVLAVTLAVAAGSAATAQPERSRSAESEKMEARYQIAVMESMLELAVQHGAQMIGSQMQALNPNLLLFTGPARARGFWLEGYGVFFDVEVPALRRSLAWSFRKLAEPDAAIDSALQALRQHVQSITDPRARTGLEQALRRVEGQLSPFGTLAGPESPAQTAPAGVPAEQDPGQLYTEEVKRALIDAMLDHSAHIAIGPDEWLIVGARDNEARLTPSDVYDAVTLILRLRGSELADFRAERLTREEARSRVEIQEF